MESERQQAATLELRERVGGRWKHVLSGRVVHGGDPVQLCFSGGWVTGRYEWEGPEHPPRFHFSVELAGGRVWESHLELPGDALLRWPDS